jgi:hypothetical protein
MSWGSPVNSLDSSPGFSFFGYFLFEVPSNLLLHKIGARIWIARILGSLSLAGDITMLSISIAISV